MNNQDQTLLDDSTLADVHGGAVARRLVLADARGTTVNAVSTYLSAFDVGSLSRDLGLKLNTSVFERVNFDPRAIGGVQPI